MKHFLGCRKSPYDGRDFVITTLVQDMLKTLPTEVDYTEEMSGIRNQSSEGSCVGHAGVAVKEWMEMKDYGLFIDLSERFLYEEAKKISGHTEGTTLVACAQVLRDKGVCEDKFWKYTAGDVQHPLPGAYPNALKFKIQAGYVRITNEEELKASLAKFGPTIIGVLVHKNWSKQQNGHIPNLSWFESMLADRKMLPPQGGHAICLVGYNDETKEYKFKNSWGEGWGDKGYGYITYKHMKQILMDAIQMVDIDDPEEFKRVKDIPFVDRRKAWV